MQARLTFGTIVLGAALACDADSGPAGTEGEQLDVPVTWSEEPLWREGEGWRLSDAPQVVIGDESDERYQFSRPVRAMRVPEGYLIINGNPPQLRFYGPEGDWLRTVGQQGSRRSESSVW